MNTINLVCDGQKLSCKTLQMASHTINEVKCKFELSSEWDDFESVSAVFKNERSDSYVMILDSNNECYVPQEVLAKKGKVYVNLAGYVLTGTTKTLQLTSYMCACIDVLQRVSASGSNSANPTAQEWQQAIAGKVDKVTGKGLSTNDYTTAEKIKLSGVESGANKYVLPNDVPHDANYVHTDNNYNAAAKSKVDAIPDNPKYTDTVYDDTEIKGDVDELKDDLTNHLTNHPSGSGTGLTDSVKQALHNIFSEVAYSTTNGSTLLSALDSAMGYSSSGGSSSGGSTDTPTTAKTLSSISATYTGGNVDAGTSVDDLTGITVIATYSDESTQTITNYTITGTIVEGSNTITITYGTKTTTITVTGVVPHSWTSGVAYENLGWSVGWLDDSTGVQDESTDWYSTDYLDIEDVTAIKYTGNLYDAYTPKYYDAEHNYIGRQANILKTKAKDGYIPMPWGVKYVRLTARSSDYGAVTITPYQFDILDENTTFVANKLYSLGGWKYGVYGQTGYKTDSWCTHETMAKCEGATTLYLNKDSRNSCTWYDSDGEYLSTSGAGNNGSYTVPDGACYFRINYSVSWSGKSAFISNNAPLAYVWLE